MRIIIQARTRSSRIPGKVLKCVNGIPLLQYTINRLRLANSEVPITVCTSHLEDDNPIYKLCEQLGVECFRGSHLNVASRYYEISKKKKFEGFVRVCADSPMVDGLLVQKIIQEWSPNLDLLSNKSPRTFPKGQSIEVVNRTTFIDQFENFKTDDDLEHVTHYFHRNIKDFKFKNIACSTDYSTKTLAIDEPEDLSIFEQFVSKYGSNWINLSFEEILEIYPHDCND
jgi:spore coat polysaccharide biosynthesis protein SpsF